MRWIFAAALSVSALAYSPARSDFFIGQTVFDSCRNESPYTQGLCHGYVIGVISGLTTGTQLSFGYYNYPTDFDAAQIGAKEVMRSCAPENMTGEQAVLVVKKYLAEHPEKLHMPGTYIIFDALVESFPCNTH